MPLPWTITTSESWPNTSETSVRSRRAAAPVSSSASTTILPLTMCRPPANRSIEATSALRQQVLVMWMLASSDFTCAVIAMGRSSHARQQLYFDRVSGVVADDPGVRRGQLDRVVTRCPGRLGDVVDHQPGAVRGHDLLELRDLLGGGVTVGEHRVDPQVRSVLGQHAQVVSRSESGCLAGLG